LKKIGDRAGKLNQQLSANSQQYLQKMAAVEDQLKAQLYYKTDSAKTRQLFARPSGIYHWDTTAITAGPSKTYVAHLDTVQTTLKYWQSKFNGSANSGSLSTALGKVTTLQSNIDQSAAISAAISARKQQLAQYLNQYSHLPPSVTSLFSKYKATAYYYRQQVDNVKDAVNNPTRLEQTALTQLAKLPVYQQFMARHSMLASLFQLPAATSDSAALAGLQTKSLVQQGLQQQVSASGQGGMAAVSQQMQQARGELSQMQNSLAKYGNSGQDLDMPDFKPNGQKTKTFLKRIVFGASLQLSQSTDYFPSTAAAGCSLGYKINDNSTAGVGLTYDLGLGQDWGHMQLSNQGLGLQSFMDWKIKGTWYVSGGYELNHLSAFSNIPKFSDINFWQPSALIGLEKKYKVSSKVQGNIQLLFDALYKQEQPEGQWFKFRIGYSFN